MLMNEDGPLKVVKKIRSLFIEMGDPEARPRNWIGEMLKCFYCTSVWVSVPFAVYISRHNWVYLPAYVFGISGLAIFANVLHERVTHE